MRNLVAVVALACVGPAFAEALHQPYAGREAREIKALSEREVADLRAGRGMGLALAAELNGYPGPLHVLEHADALGLNPEQAAATRALMDAMRAEAVPLGERLIREEAALDALFSSGAVDEARLAAATAAIGATEGALRAAHLKYHLAMKELLTPHQVRRYAQVRGYAAGGQHGSGHHGGGHPR